MKSAKNQLAIAFFCLLLATVLTAQVKTETTTSQGQPTVETTVERGEVVYVSGNDLVVKMENGEVRNFINVPDSAKVEVDGQQLSVHDLKPGMKLQRTITTTTKPQVVTTVHTVTGRVTQVNPPLWVTLALEDGSHQRFEIPRGQKFMIDGQELDAFGLKRGMNVSATKIVTEPQTLVSQERSVTGQMPPPPQTAEIQGPILIVVRTRTATVAQAKPGESQSAQAGQTKSEATEPPTVAQAKPEQAQPQSNKLPQTASELPLIGLMGGLLILSGVAVFVASRKLF